MPVNSRSWKKKMHKILILGGYGNFGQRIAIALVKKNIPIIIAGRDRGKADIFLQTVKQRYPDCSIEIAIFDIHRALSSQLEVLKPAVVIHTVGPFQTADYSVAKICIQHKVHYIDLADGRDYVTRITSLAKSALKNDVLVVSGASTVPGLSAAVIEHYKNAFSHIDSLVYGISPGQKSSRGLATTRGVLTYLGKPLKPAAGSTTKRFGWQEVYRQKYPELGKRWMANCDVPDLDLFPEKYAIKHIHFSAGMETSVLHLGIWFFSYLVRWGLPLNLARHAQALLRFSTLFDFLGTDTGGMHMLLKGKDLHGMPLEIKWFILAKNGDGLQIPCVPAIILAKKLFLGTLSQRGAIPCMGIITLDEYMDELKEFSIKQTTEPPV
jgi:hypothetical protein